MPEIQTIRDTINSVGIPGVERPIGKTNLLRDVRADDNKISIDLASTAMGDQLQDMVKNRIITALQKSNGPADIIINFVEANTQDLNSVKHVIAVMSGKGGVGKSLVTSLTAIALRRQGFEVGILDADITGPSIPMMFGINNRAFGSETGIMPVPTKTGIEVMSINLLLNREDDAVIWRGPLIGSAIKQFWEDVLWGNLDYLIVDLPPGTADAPLTVLQSLPISGVIIVFTPQELTAMVVRKAIKMAQQMNKPILGLIENMSYLYLPDLKRKIEIFGKSKAGEMELVSGAPLLAQLPIDPALAGFCDSGDIEKYTSEDIEKLGKKLVEVMSSTNLNKNK
jgi:Mrp family chromosome partitioning ATPase